MKAILIGNVYPSRGSFSFGEPIRSTVQVNGRSITAIVDAKVAVVTVTMLDDIEVEELGTYRNGVQAQIRKFINICAVETGSYHFVFLEGYVDIQTGVLSPLGNREELDGTDAPSGVQRVRQIEFDFHVVDTPAVAHALEAYNKALREHDFTAKYALEAIEAVREFWGKNEWEKMRTNLNVTKGTLTRHNTAATDQKHGRNCFQSWEQRKDQLVISREAIRRLIAHIKSGAPLPQTDYPEF